MIKSRNQRNSIRRTIEKNQTKTQFFKNIKINKSLDRLAKTKRQDTNHQYQK